MPNQTETLVVKASAEIVNNSATLQDDNELLLAVGALELWYFDVMILFDSSAVADIKVGFSGPSGSTITWGRTSLETTLLTESNSRTDPGAGVGTQVGRQYSGFIKVSTTAGNLQFRWSQNTAEVSNTTVQAGSILLAYNAPRPGPRSQIVWYL